MHEKRISCVHQSKKKQLPDWKKVGNHYLFNAALAFELCAFKR